MKDEMLSVRDCERIAIMGGTFDPIHYGHLVTAEAVRNEFEIEKVLFIPTGRPPHKKSKKISHNEHRYLMTVLATVTNSFFEASRLEIEREGYTYTIDTIRELRKICKKGTKIFFITGADAVHEILTWKDAAELLLLCEFVAVTRPGYNRTELFNEISDLKNKYESRIHFLEVPALAISSSDIRNRVTGGQSIKYLLPEAVEEYIYKNKLYGASPQSWEYIEAIIKGMLSEERYRHTLGVVEEASELARYYHGNVKKAELAALLHDCAKDFNDEEKRKLCKEYKLKLDEVMKKQIDLSHPFLGAEIAKRRFGIEDAEVLDAIRYHTTGRSNMSLLEKIIYIADCIEPNRKDYEGLEQIRELAYKDIDKALKVSLEFNIAYNIKKNRLLHPLSSQALEYLKDETKEEEKFEK